ncbi:MAG: 1-deoxy-D-xylulose-5-phosphate reductoisomerase [SAR86 cluster bacterium]|nr:1-deoxy-D-xylulose-5-phosphate reductoisomerase [SAR86 cluster bacterium]
MEKIALLGSTGSIGTSSIEVIKLHPEKFKISIITCLNNYKLLMQQCEELKPTFAFIKDRQASNLFQIELSNSSLNTILIKSEKELISYIQDGSIDTVIAGMVGISGLQLVYSSIEAGKKVLLANKESYIVAGELLNNLANKTKAVIFPLDSEHSAIHQCLSNNNGKDIKKLYITGSGGPFLKRKPSTFSSITRDEAIAHPIWDMGPKISVDSSTLMNKGLEIIEARWLFGVEERDIEVLIHPEGLIHSMVEYIDGSVLSHISVADMKVPIAYGLGYPSRIESGSKLISFTKLSSLSFSDPDLENFPSINLARRALKEGGTSPVVLNASNEVAVQSFLDKKISFLQIMELVEYIMDKLEVKSVQSIEDIFETDLIARVETNKRINSLNGTPN